MQTDKKYWFPAKRYGWGWGIPVTWQGWLVLALYAILLVAGVLLFPPHIETARFVVYVVVCSTLFTIVCWWKGEPPRWRWGGK